MDAVGSEENIYLGWWEEHSNVHDGRTWAMICGQFGSVPDDGPIHLQRAMPDFYEAYDKFRWNWPTVT